MVNELYFSHFKYRLLYSFCSAEILFSGRCAGQRASEASDQASSVWTTVVQAFSETFGSGVSRETSKSYENNFSLKSKEIIASIQQTAFLLVIKFVARCGHL